VRTAERGKRGRHTHLPNVDKERTTSSTAIIQRAKTCGEMKIDLAVYPARRIGSPTRGKKHIETGHITSLGGADQNTVLSTAKPLFIGGGWGSKPKKKKTRGYLTKFYSTKTTHSMMGTSAGF